MPAQKRLVLATIDQDERPVSIRTLGAYAETLGVEVALLVLLKPLARIGRPVEFSDPEIRQIASFLESRKATHLGFYLMTASLKPYALLAKALRAAGFRGVILAGGVHPTLCPEESLVEGADFAVQGPGELPLKLLLEGAESASIPGLVWRREGAIAVNPVTDAQKMDLDALPFPIFRFDKDRVLVDGRLRRLSWRLHRKHATWGGRYYDVVTSRGCIYRCAYCCNLYGSPVRRQTVDRVMSELKSVRAREPRVAGLNFHDDSFFAGSDEWLEAFCARMKAEVGLPFIVRMIPRYVTPERIRKLKDAGMEYVTMGLEGSDRINKTLYNRSETAESYIEAAKVILGEGVYLSTDIIIHNPYEREEDLREMAETLNELPRPNWGVVSLSLTPFPNTPLYRRCVKERSLDRFATDAYDSMLMPSREEGYRTPRFWLLLNTQVLPRISMEQGRRLIRAGPGDRRAIQSVERVASAIQRTKAITTWMQSRTPRLYSFLEGVSRLLTRRVRR